ncbi:hypothetical protein IJU97_05935 [bacterium]|nr:hypothetical protein [bacterium]
MRYSYEDLLHEEEFNKEEILDAALITHPKAKACNLTKEDLEKVLIFEKGSNFTFLEKPIIDEY